MAQTLKKIGKYTVQKTLGKGGMGVVYLCHDPDLDRKVAVKLLNKSPGIASPRQLRFLREAYTTAKLQHPGIPPVYSIHKTESNQYYYTMMPIEGQSLSDILLLLKENPDKHSEEYDLFRLVEILRDICQTIHYAHINGYMHRDLKPSNIFVGNYGEVYVIDWGLTKAIKDIKEPVQKQTPNKKKMVDIVSFDDTVSNDSNSSETEEIISENDTDTDSTLTLSGDIVGTIAYMPPEQAEGEIDELSTQTDIYALGVILYEMLTLELPVTGVPLSEIVQLKKTAGFDRPEVRSPYRSIPHELSAIAMQALSPNQEDRFKTARELNRALERWLEGKPQYRTVFKNNVSEEDYTAYPKRSLKCWNFENNAIKTLVSSKDENDIILLDKDFHGDVKITLDVIVYPVEDEVSEIGILINATEPEWRQKMIDAYSVHLGASGNTRAYLAKNDSEIASNEYISIVPRQRYRITIESTSKDITVFLDKQIILFFKENVSLSGPRVGFIHKGAGVVFSNIRVMVRGLPLRTASLEIPEALMDEKCYEAAKKRFLNIANSHRNRYEGAWARYRAGIAAYYATHKKNEAYNIWNAMKKGPFPVFADMGKAVIELENKCEKEAADIFKEIIENDSQYFYLEAISDIVFNQAQKYLRTPPKSQKDWSSIDRWTRLALMLGKNLESKKPMTPSIMWRWLYIALSEYPENLKSCVIFLRKVFGKGQGAFAEVLTCIDPLLSVLKRSLKISEHGFMIDKLMRLILSYDDHLGNLETLARFYMQSGNEDVAEKISGYICNVCKKNEYEYPPMPIVYIAILSWLKEEWAEAEEYFNLMISESKDWAVSDGKLLLGLEMYRAGKQKTALELWNDIKNDPSAISYNRHYIAQGLLEELPFDPVEADVPNRSDHRLLYCLLLSYKFIIDWKNTGKEKYRDIAIELMLKAKALIRPSHDIYSSAFSFIKIPLSRLSCDVKFKNGRKHKLSKDEVKWLAELTKAAAKDDFNISRRTTTNSGKKRSSKKN